MKRLIPLLATVALAAAAGCVPARIDPVGGLSVVGLVMKALPSASPSSGVTEVDEFGRPVPSREPPSTPSPSPSSACAQVAPATTPITGSAAQGAYAGKTLPGGWAQYGTEAAVTEAIRKLEDGENWACFKAFYGDAVTVYESKK